MAARPTRGGLFDYCVGDQGCAGSSSSPPSAASLPPSSSSSSSLPIPGRGNYAAASAPAPSSHPPLPTSLPSASSSSSSSASYYPSIAVKGNYDAASAPPAASSPSSPSSSSSAAVSKSSKDILHRLPEELMLRIAGGLSKSDEGSLAKLKLIPREQEGHLLLSYERTGEMPLSARRIPPVGGMPSIPIPENKMSFCTENTDVAILAINSQWTTLNPWRLTVLTVKLNPANIIGDLKMTMRILNGIKATLGHMKILIVVVGRLSFFFTSYLCADPFIIEVPVETYESNLVFLKSILYCLATFEFSTEGNFCQNVLDGFEDSEVFTSPLTGIIMELHDDASWDWYERAVPATGPTDPRLHLMVSIKESNIPRRSAFWSDPAKARSLLWLSYFFYEAKASPDNFGLFRSVDSGPLDFSGCTRLVELYVHVTITTLSSIDLPTAVGRLEKLWLYWNYYQGPSVSLGEGRVYPHLRHLCFSHSRRPTAMAPAAGAGAAAAAVAGPSVFSISSDQFPALQSFKSMNCRPHEVLDFSNFRTSGLSLTLDGSFEGSILMPAPDVQMGTLTVCIFSIARIRSFVDVLPRFPSLDLSCDSVKALLHIFDRVNRLPPGTSKQLASAHLKKLAIRDCAIAEPLPPFGAFPELQSLTLVRSKAILEGDDFPLLEELNLDNSGPLMRNCFSALRSLNMKSGIHLKDYTINAPLLDKLSIIDSDCANHFVLDRNLLPNLQLFTILPCQAFIQDPDFAQSLYPRIIPASKGENTELITLIYDEDTPADVLEKLQRGLRPTCPFPIQRVGKPLMDPFPKY